MKNSTINLMINEVFKAYASKVEIVLHESVSFTRGEYQQHFVYLDNGDNVIIKKIIEIFISSDFNYIAPIKLDKNVLKRHVIGTDIIAKMLDNDFKHFRLEQEVIEVNEVPCNVQANLYKCTVKGKYKDSKNHRISEEFDLKIVLNEIHSSMME